VASPAFLKVVSTFLTATARLLSRPRFVLKKQLTLALPYTQPALLGLLLWTRTHLLGHDQSLCGALAPLPQLREPAEFAVPSAPRGRVQRRRADAFAQLRGGRPSARRQELGVGLVITQGDQRSLRFERRTKRTPRAARWLFNHQKLLSARPSSA
jgi:hypothetical protein